MWKYGSVFKCMQSLLGGHRHIVSFDSFGAFANQSSSWLVQGSVPNQTNSGRVPQQCVSWSCASAAPCKSCPTAEQCSWSSEQHSEPPCRYIAKLWPGRFLVLGLMWNLQVNDVGGIICASAFMEDAQGPFRLMHLDGSISSCHCLSAGVWDLNAVNVQKSQHWLFRQREMENSLYEGGAAGLFSFA